MQATIYVIFNRTCTVYSRGTVIKLPSQLSADNLIICTSLPGLSIELDGELSLSSFANIEVVITHATCMLPYKCSFSA